jgi:hypothetical protein
MELFACGHIPECSLLTMVAMVANKVHRKYAFPPTENHFPGKGALRYFPRDRSGDAHKRLDRIVLVFRETIRALRSEPTPEYPLQ